MTNPGVLETTRVEQLLSIRAADELDLKVEVPEVVVIRLRRLAAVVLSESHRYKFLLASVHDASRWPDVWSVTTSTWKVLNHENKDNPIEFAHHLEAEDKLASLKLSGEDTDQLVVARSIFEWFEAHPEKHKDFIGERPHSKPDIFTSEGVEELVKEVLNG